MSKSYSNLDLTKHRKNKHKFRKEHGKKLHPKLKTIQGLQHPTVHNKVDGPILDYSAPSVDGKNNLNSKFVFKYNKCSPDCCPSTYTCDKGCVCTTPEQIDYINSGGKKQK